MNDQIRPRRAAIPWNRVGLFLGGWTWPVFTGVWLLQREEWLCGGLILGLVVVGLAWMIRSWRARRAALIAPRPVETLGTGNIFVGFLPALVMLPLIRFQASADAADSFFAAAAWWKLWLGVIATTLFCLAGDFLHQKQVLQEKGPDSVQDHL